MKNAISILQITLRITSIIGMCPLIVVARK